jgi:hypothetical protein
MRKDLYFYIIALRSVRAVTNIAIFCSSMMCFSGIIIIIIIIIIWKREPSSLFKYFYFLYL